jgi:hypothetical protein
MSLGSLLVGDTFIGETQPSTSTRLPGYFVRNAVALVPNWPQGEKGARSEDVTFHWNQSAEGCHVSLFRFPTQARQSADECANDGEYMWPLSGLGVRLAPDGPDSNSSSSPGSSKLILLAAKWGYVPNIAEVGRSAQTLALRFLILTLILSMQFEPLICVPPISLSPACVQVNDLPPRLFDFNFEIRGSVLVVVDNPHDPPRQWTYRVQVSTFSLQFQHRSPSIPKDRGLGCSPTWARISL